MELKKLEAQNKEALELLEKVKKLEKARLPKGKDGLLTDDANFLIAEKVVDKHNMGDWCAFINSLPNGGKVEQMLMELVTEEIKAQKLLDDMRIREEHYKAQSISDSYDWLCEDFNKFKEQHQKEKAELENSLDYYRNKHEDNN